MKEIQLTRGHVALVDDDDFEELSKWKWTFGGRYAYRMSWPERKNVGMHRQIMKCPKGSTVDHIDGNALNNQKKNLRICSRAENQCNGRKFKKTTSRYKGVFLEKNTGRWRAGIGKDYRYHILGVFPTQEAAAVAYDIAARDLHGEFANLNFKAGIHGP